jgi:hypothetical protein
LSRWTLLIRGGSNIGDLECAVSRCIISTGTNTIGLSLASKNNNVGFVGRYIITISHIVKQNSVIDTGAGFGAEPRRRG